MILHSIKSVLIASLVVLLAVCCGSSTDTTENTVKTSRTDTVTISGMAFHPAELSVNKGDTVLWINKDIVPHDVTAFPGKDWTSDTIALNTTWKKVIDQDWDYFCSIHVTMKGKVTLNN